MLTPDDIRRVAQAEIDAEDFAEEVRLKKIEMRVYVPFWQRAFPWKLTLTKRS